jgi:hypothetical protein
MYWLLIIISLALHSCVDESFGDEIGSYQGLRPLYAAGDDWKLIESLPPQPVRELGKIYYKDQHIYVNERNAGIHIIDNSIPTNPTPIRFISIPGSRDISIKGDFLYSDNVTDLVVLDISDFQNITEVNRVAGIYPMLDQSYPEFYNGFFECVDASKGTVIAWEETIFTQMPHCRR